MSVLPSDLVDTLRGIRSMGVITGAGVSAESGIRTYRGKGGLYDDEEEGQRTVEALSGSTLRADPDRTWRVVAELARRSVDAAPNAAHRALVAIEDALEHFVLLTQNVDGLHRMAGTRNLIDIHGDVLDTRCMQCAHRGRMTPEEVRPLQAAPMCPDCGGILRPDAVLFGEMLPGEKLRRLEAEMFQRMPDLVLIAGTTAVFPYIAEPVLAAARAGRPTVEVNPEATPLSEHVRWSLRGTAGTWLPLVAEVITSAATPPRRAMCARCERPVSVCYCSALTTIETRSRIVILQHPREHGMPIGTARMAHLCLPQSSLHVGTRWDESEVLRTACDDPQRPPILLYPGPGARDILREPPSSPVTLIVVDGTWSQARSVVRKNPRLAELPRYGFAAPEPSNYRIRREPSVEYVSTIEAIMHVLGALEGDPERFRALMRPMNAMVDAQLDAQAKARTSATEPRKPRSRPQTRVQRTPYERLPAQIRDRYEDLVLVYGDANAWPYGTPENRLGDELVYWVAHRPSTGESFSFVIAPRNPLAPDIPRHTELSAERLLAGGSVTDMLTAFAAFTRPTDVITSWGHHGLRMFQECGGTLPGAYLDLQQVARDLTNRKTGTLEHFAAEFVGAPVTGLPPGRAGRRLGLLLDILDTWRALPKPEPCG